MESNEHICILMDGEECVNNNDCENCDYGVEERFFAENKIS